MDKIDQLWEIFSEEATLRQDFFTVLNAGPGNLAANEFIRKIKQRAVDRFGGAVFSEALVAVDFDARFDYFFPEEETVVEIALSLHAPMNEFQKDIFKCLLGREYGKKKISRLVFFTKEPGQARLSQPFNAAIKEYVSKNLGLKIEVREFAHPR